MFTRAFRHVQRRRRLLASVGVAIALIVAPLGVMPLPVWATGSGPSIGPYYPTDGVLDGGPTQQTQTDPTGNADTSNYGGGSKESDSCPTSASGTAAPKDDLDQMWIDSADTASGVIAYMAWHRLDTSGTTTSDFELNRQGSATPGCFNRSQGDMLITYDFQGSGPFTISVMAHVWDATHSKWTDFPLRSSSWLAGINHDGSFGEMAINLTAAGLLDSELCQDVTSVTAKTRSSSASFENEIKDWVTLGVTVSNCGHIDIHKTDETGAPLPGAVFTLYTDGPTGPGVPVSPPQSCTTNASGTCTILDIRPGTYWVVETTTPEGHRTADPRRVTVALAGNSPGNSLTFVDPRQPATVNIIKHDDAGAALAGATFGLYNDNGGVMGSAVSGQTCTTDASGLCSISGILPPGTYWLHETVVPDGYTIAPDQKTTLAVNQTVTLRFVDDRIPAAVRILKQDDTGVALSGAGFGLYSDDNGLIGSAVTGKTCTTDGNGQCSISGILPPGTYWLRETTVPAGYTAGPDQQVILQLADVVTLTFVDNRIPATVLIVKKDDTGAALSGATFGLYNDKGGVIGSAVAGESCTTDGNGRCSITGIVPSGTYWLHETGVPDGYTAAPDRQITPGLAQTLEVDFVDGRLPATVKIVKTDDTGAALSGATFGLFADNDGHIGPAVTGKSCTTDNAGTCSIGGILPSGTYWLRETGVPDGYTAAADQKVTVALNQTVRLPAFVDGRLPATVNIVKTDDTGAALYGATFGLFADNDGHIGPAVTDKSCTTDNAGTCSIGGILPPGTYWLHETGAPSGFGAAPDQSVDLQLAQTVTLTFVDARLPVHVAIHKVDDNGAPVPGARFGLFTAGEEGPLNAVTGTVPNSGTCTTDTQGDCTLSAIVSAGRYWVVETVTPSGYGTAPAQWVDLVPGHSVTGDATLTFTDQRQPSGISIVKQVNGVDTAADQPLDAEVGSLLSYRVTVTNTGQIPLTIRTLEDSLHADLPARCDAGIGDVLTAGKSFSCRYTAVAADLGSPWIVHNHVTVTGEDQFGRRPSAQDDAWVHVLDPAVHIAKAGPASAHVGDTVTWTLTVSNPGNTGLLDVHVTDPRCDVDPVRSTADADGILSPGETWIYTCAHVVAAADGNQFVNTASVTGRDSQNASVSDDDSVTTAVLRPAIAVTKTGSSNVHVGDPVLYTIVVSNPGNAPLSGVRVTDPKCDGQPVRSTDDADGLLSPGEEWAYHCTHVATAGDGASIVNTATAQGTDPLGETVSGTANAATAVLHPAITMDKTASPDSISGPSGSVTYTYVVTNTGDATLFDVLVTDDILGAIGHIATLAPGQSITMAKTVDVDASTPPTNVGTVTASDVLGETVTATDPATITVVLGAVETRPAPAQELPRTGAPLEAETRAALALIEIGLMLELSARSRRRTRRRAG
jgi:hypothetical protein